MSVPLDLSRDTHTTTSAQITELAPAVPDAFFDRQWALNVIDRSLSALGAEFVAAAKGRHFETLKPWLLGEVGSLSQSEAAQQLVMSEGAIKVAIHRLRKRFRELVKEEIAGTLDQPVTIQEELCYLLEALAQC
jgi:DNA-directed RNA polymerase specialized sigma24 family protein